MMIPLTSALNISYLIRGTRILKTGTTTTRAPLEKIQQELAMSRSMSYNVGGTMAINPMGMAERIRRN
jgi:hypothetical protein